MNKFADKEWRKKLMANPKAVLKEINSIGDVDFKVVKNTKNTIFMVVPRTEDDILNSNLHSLNAAAPGTISSASTAGTISSMTTTVITAGTVGTAGSADVDVHSTVKITQ